MVPAVLVVSVVLVDLVVPAVLVASVALVAVRRLHLADPARYLRPVVRVRHLLEEGRGLNNGSTTRNIGKGLLTATLPHVISIPRQTAQPWTTG